jgi:hypothetical protein
MKSGERPLHRSDALNPLDGLTIRVRGGKVSTTDGPSPRRRSSSGFFLIEAKDIDEGCGRSPAVSPARVGIIEVRPVRELTHS